MGFIDTAPGTTLPVFFNVVKAVGQNCPNQPDDVKLVQYLLIALYEKFPPSARPKGEIAVTGFCGGATLNWILKFQLDVSSQLPRQIAVDGRIDRVRQKNLIGSLSKTTYTLAILNANAAVHNPAKFALLPQSVPLQNPGSVPLPTPDIVFTSTPPGIIPETGGF